MEETGTMNSKQPQVRDKRNRMQQMGNIVNHRVVALASHLAAYASVLRELGKRQA